MPEPRVSFRMNLVTLCALTGGVIAFVVTGALFDVLLVAFGALVGATIGWAVQRFARDAHEYRDAMDSPRGRRTA